MDRRFCRNSRAYCDSCNFKQDVEIGDKIMIYSEFKRKFSMSMYKNLKIRLAKMTFFKDFVRDMRGDLYPIAEKSEDCIEEVCDNRYILKCGSVKRVFCQFFPFATYEIIASGGGASGFCFELPGAKAEILLKNDMVLYRSGEHFEERPTGFSENEEKTMIVSCRPGAFDVYFKNNGMAQLFCTFSEDAFAASNVYEAFTNGYVLISAEGNVTVKSVISYVDNGVSIADIRPIKFENGDTIYENGKIHFSASVRLESGGFQGIFSWIPGTAEIEMTGALFFDNGDGIWRNYVASAILYNRKEKLWYLWVVSFGYKHILAHAAFDGDPRFGVNVVDVHVMDEAEAGTDFTEFIGFRGDEDPDLYYDEERKKWIMAICRVNPENKQYAYLFFESERPFEGYSFIGRGPDGCETGGSFVKINGERYFVCGNSFEKVSDYRIYSKNGVKNAEFNFPDGGFRGWGTVIPIRAGSRTRLYWLTFDRHNGSADNWSYGNLYCFEGSISS